MKLFFAICLLFFISICSFGQTPKLNASDQHIDSLLVFLNTVKTPELIANEAKKDTIEIIDIKREHWETTVFNPYKGTNVKFPIKIKFNDSLYASPITRKKVVTSRFGWRYRRPHKGIDIDLVTGDSVVSILDGIVRFASYNSGHGKTVIVRHFNGLETVYAHLSNYNVKVNDTVARGQLLGKGGKTGNARGSHLHLVINYKGVAINPDYFFDFTENNIVRAKEIWVTKKWTRASLHNHRRISNVKLLLTEADAVAEKTKEKKIYTVKRGDTLSRISANNNVSIASICKANYIKKTSVIKVGQKLVLEL